MLAISFANQDWQVIVDRLGGAEAIDRLARQTKAFRRGRGIATAVDLLRLVLSYCLGDRGVRSTAAWASAVGLADVSNVAVLYRLRQCGEWLAALVSQALADAVPPGAGRGRMLRLIDATAVPQQGTFARQHNHLWRVHSAFDLPAERFGCLVLTDHTGGERLDRIPVERGEIRIADRAYLQPERIAAVLADDGDVVVRAAWKNACWLTADGQPCDLIAVLRGNAEGGLIDQPIWIGRAKGQPALGLRLVAVKKSPRAAEAARRAARRQAQRGGHQISSDTLTAADWVILVTSLPAAEFPTADILALYRLRWRIELTFKRLKSLIGLKRPPGTDERSAKPYVLAHLLMILLLEPLIDELGDPPPGRRRLTPPGRWRLLRQLLATPGLRRGIMPQPDLATLINARLILRRHLCEPPRKKRTYQGMPCLI
jgi:Transposase DDE domain